MPRPNGYQSLHTSVISEGGLPFEVQIRTLEMHRRAEEGIAAHWKYKEGRVGDRARRAVLPVDAPAARYPAGGPRPAGVHSEPEGRAVPGGGVHLHAQGAREGASRAARRRSTSRTRFTPMSAISASARASTARWFRSAPASRTATSSRSSTSAGHKPSRDWLNFVVTSHARNKIKHLIHSEEKTRAIELGRKLFEKDARRFDLQSEDAARQRRRCRKCSPISACRSRDDVFAAIGYGKAVAEAACWRSSCRPTRCARRRRKGRSPPRSSACSAPAKKRSRSRGFDDLMVFRARCCNPIRGEKIVGYITRGKGVSVHSSTCPNVVNLLYDPGAAHRRRMGQGLRRRRGSALHREADDGGRGPEGTAGGGQREDRRHQYEHQEHGSAHRRRSARAHRHDRRDQRSQAPRKGDQVAARRSTACSMSNGREGRDRRRDGSGE